MKEWQDGKDVETLEEGLQQEKQEFIRKLKYNTNCCKQWTRCIRLIFLLQLTLFFGWGCYMILQNYHFRVTENEIADITRERYLPLMSEIQKSHPAEKMSAIFVKPEITDKLNNNFLEAIGLKEPYLMPSKTIEIAVDSSMQTSTQNSISMPNNNIMEASDINNPLMTSSSEDKGLLKIMSWTNFPLENSDITFNNNEKSNTMKQFLEKLYNIAINNDLKNAINNDFTENVDPLMLNQEDRAPNAFNEIESVRLNVMISKVEDTEDLTKSLKNSAQDLDQIFLDMSEPFAVQDDHSEKNSLKDGTDEQINASLQSDFVICPPNQSHESSGMSSEHLIQSSFASQIGSIEESSKKIKNNADNMPLLMLKMFNEDKSVYDSNMSSKSDENFDTRMSIVQDTKDAEDLTKSLKNSAQDLEQIFLEMSKQFAVQDDHSEKSFSKEGTDKQINASSQSDSVIYPSNQSSESSSMSSEHLIQSSFASQIGSIEESPKQIKNNADDNIWLSIFNEDEYDDEFNENNEYNDYMRNILKKIHTQDPKQIFLDMSKQFAVQDDHSEKSSSKEGTDKQINASSQSDSVIYPSNQSSESSSMSSEHLIQSSFASQIGSIEESPKQIKNNADDNIWLSIFNEDEYDDEFNENNEYNDYMRNILKKIHTQDPKQIFLDMSKQFAVQDDHSEKSSSKEGTDKQINASSQSDSVIYPSNQSSESSSMSSEHLIQSSFASQIGSIEESPKQIKNNADDNIWLSIFNEDEYDDEFNENNEYNDYMRNILKKIHTQDPKQIFLDMSKQFAVQDDHSEKSSSKEGTDEQINASSQSDSVIYPSNQSSESSSMSSEHLIQSSFASQIGSIEESSKQIKNNADDNIWSSIFNKDEYDDEFNENEYNDYVRNILKKIHTQHPKQIFLDMSKQFAVQDDSEKSSSKDETNEQINASSQSDSVIYPPNQSSESSDMSSVHSIQNFFGLQDGSILSDDKMPDTAKSSTSNFEWLNAPPTSADNLQSGPEDILESNKNLKRKRRNPSLEDRIENTETIDAFIPEKNKIHNQSHFKTKNIDSDNPENDSEIRRQERIIFNALNNFKPADISKYNFNMPDYTFNVNDIDIEKIEDELKYETVQLNDELLSNKNFDNKIEDVEMHIGI